jgi:hypothetical protein
VLAASAAHAEISKRDMQVLSKEPAPLHRDGPHGRESEQGRAGLFYPQPRQQRNPHSDRAQYLEGQAHPARQPGAGVDRQCKRSGLHRQGQITSDAAVQKKILNGFREKYWQNRLLGIGPSRAEFDNGNCVAIIITPIRDLPGGFASAPGTPPPLKMLATGSGIAP